MEQALLIVWRESVEALLVIGILFAWLRQQPGRRHAMVYLWGGVGLGLLLAGLLAGLMALAGNWMNGPSGEWFQAGLSLVASLLILQMACWMARVASGLSPSMNTFSSFRPRPAVMPSMPWPIDAPIRSARAPVARTPASSRAPAAIEITTARGDRSSRPSAAIFPGVAWALRGARPRPTA